MTILQAVNNIIKAFAQITSEENKHKKFNNIVDFMISLYYYGKDTQTQELLPIEEEIFKNANNLLKAPDVDKYHDCINVILAMYEQLPYTDILGEFYQIEISKGDNMQFFTPDAVCNLMAQISIPEIRENMRINDDCCGCGRTLLAGAKYIALQQEKTLIRPQDVYFIGRDIDNRCIRVTLLNLCLHKLKGLLTCGDTLLNTAKYHIRINYTFPRVNGNGQIVWYMGKISQWQAQTPPVLQGQSQNNTKQESMNQKQEPITIDLTKINEQLTLF